MQPWVDNVPNARTLTVQITESTYVIGDIHGQFKTLVKLLRHAGLVGDHHAWKGGNATLWFMGDLVDRGPDGIAVVDLAMNLQAQAAAAGGRVAALLGNHEVLLLGAYRFGRRSTGLSSNFIAKWKQNGGNRKDLAALTPQHLDWLSDLPAMAHVDDYLLIHADAPFYIKYGSSEEEVNAAFKKILKRSNALDWEELIEDFSRRGAFLSSIGSREFIQRFLNIFRGRQIVHGHTPISAIRGCPAKKVTEPWIYAGGQCINVDGGIYLGGPGFIHQLPGDKNAEENGSLPEEGISS
jgi:hypothetical protein